MPRASVATTGRLVTGSGLCVGGAAVSVGRQPSGDFAGRCPELLTPRGLLGRLCARGIVILEDRLA